MNINRILYLGTLLGALSFSCGAAGDDVTASTAAAGIRAEFPLADARSLAASEKIVVGFLCLTGSSAFIFYPKPEFLARAQLIDSARMVVPTSPGNVFGSRFSELTNYSFDAVEKVSGGSNDGNPKIGHLRDDLPFTHILPAPRDLFQISEPGNYRLRLELQVFKRVPVGTNFTLELIKFPAVELPVVEKEKKRGNNR